MKVRIIIAALIVLLALVLMGLGVWLGSLAFGSGSANPSGPSPYSAVYLSTGDLYYGKLSWFPSPHLTDAWVLTRGQNASGQSQIGVEPFTSSFWGPVDEIDLNPREIVFWTRLRNNSQIAQTLANPSSGMESAVPTTVASSTGTSTFQGPSGLPPSAR